MNLIETRGTGIQLIYDSCKKAGIKKPVYHEEGDFVKIVFSFESDPNQYKSELDAILAYIKIQHSVTAQQIADYLSVSRNTAIRKLNQLVKEKHIVKKGKGPSVRYTL